MSNFKDLKDLNEKISSFKEYTPLFPNKNGLYFYNVQSGNPIAKDLTLFFNCMDNSFNISFKGVYDGKEFGVRKSYNIEKDAFFRTSFCYFKDKGEKIDYSNPKITELPDYLKDTADDLFAWLINLFKKTNKG